MGSVYLLVLTIFFTIFQGHANVADILRHGQGQTNDQLLLLDNYIPAAMQVIFYLTDAMKYEIKPTTQGMTTTTIRPTPPHKPGNYAPEVPPGAQAYFAKSSLRSNSRTDDNNDGNKGERPEGDYGELFRDIFPEVLSEDLDLLGAGPSDLLHQINSLGDFDTVGDEVDEVLRFSVNYEDNVNVDFFRQKRVPPTRAYVTLLSLYDLLNKEAKEKGLNKYNGYVDRIVQELADSSQGTAENQLKFVLSKIMETKNTRKANIVKKIKALLEDIDKPDSYISDALKFIPSLQFSI